MTVLGLDTSNYTTSIAFLGDDGGEIVPVCCPVKPGELGLRQSDAVFHHREKPAGAFGQAVSPFGRTDRFRRGCQHPAKSRGGKLYALLSGGVFPCGNAGPMPERAAV